MVTRNDARASEQYDQLSSDNAWSNDRSMWAIDRTRPYGVFRFAF
jgi:hypothetical protein